MKREAKFYKKLNDGKVECFLCAHNCKIKENSFGICGVRKNEGGVLYTQVHGEVIASHIDPIEKKPLYHFLPGSLSYSIATVGCNLRCSFCQNWRISQAAKENRNIETYELAPEEVVREAVKHKCRSISYTYTEPTIFFEYAYDISKLAREKGLKNVFVTNGYMRVEALEEISPYLDACNVDLKSFSDDFYRTMCGARLQPVTESIKKMKELGIHIEVTTLIIPNKNDSKEELKKIAQFIAGVDNNIPWHVSRFHPDYRYIEGDFTPIATLKTAETIGKNEGLKYIYLGNVLEGNNTYCYNCNKLLLERHYFDVIKNDLDGNKCDKCKTVLEGVF